MKPVSLFLPEGHVLSTPRAGDVDTIYTLCQDPDIQRWTTVPKPYERQHAESFVHEFVRDGWDRDTDYVWAIRHDDDSPVLGVIDLQGIADGSAEVGYWFGPASRGQGLATSALVTVADFAFGELGLIRLSWAAAVGNNASRRVAERAGFRIEGQVRGFILDHGVREDAWLGTRYADDPKPGSATT